MTNFLNKIIPFYLVGSLLFLYNNSCIAQTPEIADSLWNEANKAIEDQDFEKGVFLFEQTINAELHSQQSRDNLIVAASFFAAGYYVKLNNKEKAIQLLEETMSSENNFDQNMELYGPVKYLLTSLYLVEGKHNNASIFIHESLQFAENQFGKFSNEYLGLRFMQAQILSENNLREESIEVLSQIINNKEKIENTEIVFNSISKLAELYEELEQFQDALKMYFEKLEMLEKLKGKAHFEYGDYLYNLAKLNDKLGKKESALLLYKEAIENAASVYGKENKEYLNRIKALADFYKKHDQYQEAIYLAREALHVSEILFGSDNMESVKCINDLSRIYLKKGNLIEAETYFLRAIKILESTGNNENVFFYDVIGGLASLYDLKGDYKNAMKLYEKATVFFESSEEYQLSKSYGILVGNYAGLYNRISDYDKAIKLYNKALSIIEKNKGRELNEYGSFLNNLALVYQELGLYEKAHLFCLKSTAHAAKTMGESSGEYAIRMGNLANVKQEMGQTDQALKLYEESLVILENTFGKTHHIYATHLNNIAGLYAEKGQFDKSIPFYNEALEITEKVLGKTHPDFSTRLNNIATVCEKLGQLEKALEFSNQALEIKEKSIGKNHSDYANNLNNLAGIYKSLGQYDNALNLYIQSKEITEKVLGKNHPDYSTRLNNLATVYQIIGECDKAFQLFLESKEITEKTLGKEHPDYAIRLNNIAKWYCENREYEKAIPLYLEALENTQKNYENAHPTYAIRLNNLSSAYQKIGQYDKALPLYQEALENTLGQIDQAFSFMSENEKEQFVKTIGFNIEAYQSFFKQYANQKTEVATHAYDIELATKGMILQSGIDSRKAILNSGDSASKAKFEEWSLLRAILAKQYSLPLAERRSDVKELEEKAEKAEATLSRISTEFQKERQAQQIRWQQVQKALKPNELALEFAAFNYHNGKWTDSVMYVALLLRKHDKYPLLIPLFEEKQLDALLSKNEDTGDQAFVSALYRGVEVLGMSTKKRNQGKALYDLIWKPIVPYLDETQNVYFAPSGKLHQIAFAALPTGKDSALLSDHYNLQQLSTTAVLARNEWESQPKPIQNAVLFGGIQYDLNSKEWVAEAQKIQTEKDLWASRSLPEDLDRGGSWSFLPGTLQEVESIASLFKSHHVPCQEFKASHALEEVFKQQSGIGSPEVLHIATHGFFFPDPNVEKPEHVNSLGQENQLVFKQSENPLYRSGLLFAGANHTWKGEPTPTGLEDGILSAYEVSHLYLPNTQLVVLSACETGLGDIKGGEGVFGLQRAFKQAGVEYLIMSLWKVPDTETSEFMQYFYSALLSGKTIPEAFRLTQNEMKRKHPNDPYKWAAFVLVR
jgi:tetratricopeptide (TPR) repeat protein